MKDNSSKNKNMGEMRKKLEGNKEAISHEGSGLDLSRHRHLSRIYPGKTPRVIIDKRYYKKRKYILEKQQNTKIKGRIENETWREVQQMWI